MLELRRIDFAPDGADCGCGGLRCRAVGGCSGRTCLLDDLSVFSDFHKTLLNFLDMAPYLNPFPPGASAPPRLLEFLSQFIGF